MRWDGRAVIGMPIKLAVSFMIVALMLPVVSQMVDEATEESDAVPLRSEALRLREAIGRVFYSSQGTVEHLTMDLPVRAELRVGGEGSDAYSIRMFLDGVEVGRLYLDRPQVPVRGDETVLVGGSQVSVSNASGADGRWVRVSA